MQELHKYKGTENINLSDVHTHLAATCTETKTKYIWNSTILESSTKTLQKINFNYKLIPYYT